MCIIKGPKIAQATPTAPQTTAAPALIAAGITPEANESSDIEARLRRRRSGAAATVLTSPLGIPATGKLGTAA
ncbi:MAG: hypothetical protein AAF408_03280 [Pseudomonadota bacterium]